MSRQTYKKKLDKIESAHAAALNKLGDEIRQQLVLPFCRKHRLTYVAGNGTYFFVDADDRIVETENKLATAHMATAPRGMRSICDVLDTQVDDYNSLGDYVSRVDAKDLDE